MPSRLNANHVQKQARGGHDRKKIHFKFSYLLLFSIFNYCEFHVRLLSSLIRSKWLVSRKWVVLGTVVFLIYECRKNRRRTDLLGSQGKGGCNSSLFQRLTWDFWAINTIFFAVKIDVTLPPKATQSYGGSEALREFPGLEDLFLIPGARGVHF